MQVFRRAPRDDRPLTVAAPDRKAALERAEYLMAHYHAPAHVAERVVTQMDVPTQTLLAIEMAESRRATYTADYDPFRGM